MDAKRSKSRAVLALRRKGRLIASLALGAALVASLVSILRPRDYTASAGLEIGLSGGSAGEDFLERAGAVRERLLAYDAFAAVVARLPQPDAPEREQSVWRETRITELRRAARVDIEPAGAGRAVAKLVVRDGDGDAAAHVAAGLGALGAKLTFDASLAQQEKDFAAAESAVAAAQEVHDRAAKEHAAFQEKNREFLQGAGEQLAATREQRNKLKENVTALEQQRKQLEDLLAQERQFDTVVVRQPDRVKLAGIEDRIAGLKERIRRLTIEDGKTDDDSEVVADKKALADLEEDRRRLIADAPAVEQRQPNEQWVKLSEARAEVQSQLDAAHRQIRLLASTEREQEELARRSPEVEAQERELAAAAAAAKSELDAKTQARDAAQSALEAARARGSLVVRAVAAPAGPARPSGPGALVLSLGGLLLGALGGAAAALAADRADKSFRDAASVASFMGVPTLGAVEPIRTAAEEAQLRAANRRAKTAMTGFAVAVGIVFCLALIGDVGTIADFVKSVVG